MSMVKAVQAEDAVSEHFDGLLKNRVEAEVSATDCMIAALVHKHSTTFTCHCFSIVVFSMFVISLEGLVADCCSVLLIGLEALQHARVQ